MSGFHFSLEKALELRRLQLRIEETGFQRQTAVLLALDRDREELRGARARADAILRQGSPVQGRDLAALSAFRLHLQVKEKELAQRRAGAQKKLEEGRAAMLEARRRCRLMEKLKERRRAEWDAARNRELEQLASESFLARWNRGHA